MWTDSFKSVGRAVSGKSFLFGLGNWALLLAGFVMLGRGVWIAFADVTSGIALLGAGAVLIFAGSIDRFESLKGLGLEAKTRELDRKIDQAEVIFGHLKELAAVAYGSLIAQGAKVGRWGGAPSFEELHTLVSNSRAQMRALGVQDEAQNTAVAPWVDMALHDWMRAALAPLFDALRTAFRADAAQRQRYDAALYALFETRAGESLDSLSAFIAEFEGGAPEAAVAARDVMRDWSAELDYLIHMHELKTPARWYELMKRRP